MLKILVVEDDRYWGSAIKKMYETIFQPPMRKPEVELIDSGAKAIKKLRTEKFDLLSLDISLRWTHETNNDGSPNTHIQGSHGLDVLEEADDRDACKAVIVITGIHQDDTFDFLDKDTRRRIKSTLSAHFQKTQFRDHWIQFHKVVNGNILNDDTTISENIEDYKQALSPEFLNQLCDRSYSAKILFNQSGNVSCIRFQARSTESTYYIEERRDDIEFLYQMIKRAQGTDETDSNGGKIIWSDRRYVINGEIMKINKTYGDEEVQKASTYINSFRRRLKKKGIFPEEIFTTYGEGNSSGWILKAQVELE